MGEQSGFLKEKRIFIGKILRAHGIRGGVKVELLSRGECNLKRGRVFLTGKDGRITQAEIIKVRQIKEGAVVELKGISTRSEAEKLRGVKIALSRSDLPETAKNEYYCADLWGIEVFDGKGIYLGKIKAIYSNNAQDIFLCQTPSGEFMFPAVRSMIISIDLTNKKMVVELPEGLIEANRER